LDNKKLIDNYFISEFFIYNFYLYNLYNISNIKNKSNFIL